VTTFEGIANFVLGLFGGIAGAAIVVAFLAKTLIANMLDRGQKKYKADLDAELAAHNASLKLATDSEIERIRTVGNIARVEHEIMLSRLQDRRARVIGLTFARLVDALEKTERYVHNSSEDDSDLAKRLNQEALEAIGAASNYFNRQRVWLPRDSSEKIGALMRELRSLQIARQVFGWRDKGHRVSDEISREGMSQALVTLQEKVPNAIAALEDEMRALLDPRLPVPPPGP
jgi:hypothetical protein